MHKDELLQVVENRNKLLKMPVIVLLFYVYNVLCKSVKNTFITTLFQTRPYILPQWIYFLQNTTLAKIFLIWLALNYFTIGRHLLHNCIFIRSRDICVYPKVIFHSYIVVNLTLYRSFEPSFIYLIYGRSPKWNNVFLVNLAVLVGIMLPVFKSEWSVLWYSLLKVRLNM